MSALPSLPVDLDALDVAETRLERALELVRVIRGAGLELAELVGQDLEDGATARATTLAIGPGPAVRDVGEDADQEPAPPHSPPRPDSAADGPPTSAAEPPAATPAPTPSTPPRRAPAKARPRPRSGRADELVAWAGRVTAPGGWFSVSDACRGLDVHGTIAKYAITQALERELLEHNGKGTTARRYRLAGTTWVEDDAGAEPAADQPPGPAPESELPVTDDEPTPEPERPRANPGSDPIPTAEELDALEAEGRAQPRVDPGPPPVSPRVRKAMEREQADAGGRILAGPAGSGTLHGRILSALTAGATGIRGLARRLEVPTEGIEELVLELNELVKAGDVHRFENPRRATIGEENPLFEVRP